jgi:hypothetical protein
MRNTKDRSIDPLPEEFGTPEEAARFWDAHSITDYEESLEPADLDVDVQRRHFEIEVDEEAFQALHDSARKQHRPAKELASEILKQRLAG